jgi:hypothetical protein
LPEKEERGVAVPKPNKHNHFWPFRGDRKRFSESLCITLFLCLPTPVRMLYFKTERKENGAFSTERLYYRQAAKRQETRQKRVLSVVKHR